MEFKPHSGKQIRAIRSDARIVLCATGIQWGKTRVGAVRKKIRMHKKTMKGRNFIIAAPNYKIMQQSTLPAFLGMMEGCGHYNKAEAVFETNWGTNCFMRTGTDPDSVVGITDCEGIWGDEAGKFSLYFWENLQARASFLQCPIDLTTSPYALNWMFKEIIRPKMRDPGARPDVEMIQARSNENPFFPDAEYERKRLTMDPRRFNAIYGGKWEKMAGLVYDCFDDVDNVCDPHTLPPGTVYIGGIDWGYTAPFVLKVRAITPDDKHYSVFEFYKTGQTLAQKIEVARQAKAIFGVKRFECDPEDPASIAAFNEAKLTAVAANNDVRAGIDAHYELVKTRRYKIFRGTAPHTMDEYETYHYPDPDDVGPDDDVREEKPVKQGDHAMDVERYISLATRRGVAKKGVRVPPEEKTKHEDQEARLRRLMKKKGSEQTEKWSA